MDLSKFALGINFYVMPEENEQECKKRVFKELFSALTLSDLKGLSLYGMFVKSIYDAETFCLMIKGKKLSQMRKVYNKIKTDEILTSYVISSASTIENNRLAKYEEQFVYYGDVAEDGSVTGGEGVFGFSAQQVGPKRRIIRKRKRILIASCDFASMGSGEAVKKLGWRTFFKFKLSKRIYMPLSCNGEEVINTLVPACSGAYRKAKLANGEKCSYGVIYAKKAIISEYRDEIDKSSFFTGEQVLRALNEGIKEIWVYLDKDSNDSCMGLLQALGVRFFDEYDNEIMNFDADSVARIENENIHPGLASTKLTIIDINKKTDKVIAQKSVSELLRNPHIISEENEALSEMLNIANFDTFVKKMALVISCANEKHAQILERVIEVCTKRNIKIKAALNGKTDDERIMSFNVDNNDDMEIMLDKFFDSIKLA